MYAYADYEVLDYIEYGGEYGRAANRVAGGGRSTSSTTPPVTFSGTYYIKNVNSGKFLDVKNGWTTDETQVWQWNFNATAAQQWTITHLGNGVHHIVPKHTTGKRLDINGGGDVNGTKVQIYSNNTSDAQKFRFGRTGFSGSYTIKPTYTTRVLDVEATSTAAGAKVQLWQNNGGTNQQWNFAPTSSFLSAGLSRRSVTIRVNRDSSITNAQWNDMWLPAIRAAANSWNNSGAGVNVTITTTGTSEHILTVGVQRDSMGNIESWDGLYVPNTKTGAVTSSRIYINTVGLYNIGANGTPASLRRAVIAHEIGHMFWLKDNPATTQNSLMRYQSVYDNNISTPQSLDVNNVQFVYE